MHFLFPWYSELSHDYFTSLVNKNTHDAGHLWGHVISFLSQGQFSATTGVLVGVYRLKTISLSDSGAAVSSAMIKNQSLLITHRARCKKNYHC